MAVRSGSNRFGAYRLGRALGGGGIGEVFAATRADAAPGAPEAPLALKRLYAEHLARPELVAIFAAECDHATRFRHPHLARAVDRGAVDGVPYLVMRHAGDANLATAPLPRDRVAGAGAALASALDHLHAAGFVHADVNPRNVVVGAGGELTLVDFGAITALGTAQPRPTGTYAYMAPEQARGEVLDAAADQFALAVLLWEQLAGRRLFRRSAPHLSLVAVVEDEVPPLPPPLSRASAALARALAKDAGARYGSCAELAAELAAALA